MDSHLGYIVTVCHLSTLPMRTKGSPVNLPILNKIPVKSLYSPCTDLVVYGSMGSIGSTTGINLNNFVRNITPFPQAIVSQLVGHMLGDGALTMSWSSVTPSFVFTQTLKRFGYI